MTYHSLQSNIKSDSVNDTGLDTVKHMQGFQEGLSCATASFTLQDTVCHTIEKGSNAYVACLDQKAAFDSLWHKGLFLIICGLGLTGKILRLLIAAYSRLKCVVPVNGITSESIDVKQLCWQGGVLSTFLYLIYINQFLLELGKPTMAAKYTSLHVWKIMEAKC